jgi:hypothetical protein
MSTTEGSEVKHTRRPSIEGAKQKIGKTASRFLSVGKKSRKGNGSGDQGKENGGDESAPLSPETPSSPVDDNADPAEPKPRLEGEFGEERDGWTG